MSLQIRSIQSGFLLLAVFSLALLGAVEVLLRIPVPGGWYLGVVPLLVLGLLRRQAFAAQRDRVWWLVVCLGLLAVLHFVPWSTRKPFLRDLGRIQPGMTEAEARQIMGRYLEGTGWPGEVDGAAVPAGRLHDLGSGATLATKVSPDGQLGFRNAVVYRHSTQAAFNSDWGIVTFKDGKVSGVSFSPD